MKSPQTLIGSSREGFYDLDHISAHQGGGDPAKFQKFLRRRPQGPPKWGPHFGFFSKNGPVEASGGCGSVRNQKLVWTLDTRAFPEAPGTRPDQKGSKTSILAQNPGGCMLKNPSLYQPLGLGYWFQD